MGHTVELHFDANAEAELLALRATLTKAGLPDTFVPLGSRPHVSLAGFSSVDPQALIEHSGAFAASAAPFDLKLSHIGAFPTEKGVVFCEPTPATVLLDLHRAFCERLLAACIRPDDYYVPGVWIPHCTIALGLTPAQMATAVRVSVEVFQPIHATCREIGVISFPPVRSLAVFRLGTEAA